MTRAHSSVAVTASSLFCLLFALVPLASAQQAFPARFFHALPSAQSEALTLKLTFGGEEHSCSTTYGKACTFGNLTSFLGMTVTNSKGVILMSKNATSPMTVGMTFVAANDTTGVAQAAIYIVDDGPAPSEAPVVTFANFLGDSIDKIAAESGVVVYATTLTYGFSILSFVAPAAGDSELVVQLATRGTSQFDIDVDAHNAYLMVLLPGPKDTISLVQYQTVDSGKPDHHNHHHMWLPITIVLIVVPAFVLIAIGVWCWRKPKEPEEAYEPIQ